MHILFHPFTESVVKLYTFYFILLTNSTSCRDCSYVWRRLDHNFVEWLPFFFLYVLKVLSQELSRLFGLYITKISQWRIWIISLFEIRLRSIFLLRVVISFSMSYQETIPFLWQISWFTTAHFINFKDLYILTTI